MPRGSALKQPAPTLTPEHWRRHGAYQLLHTRSKLIVTFIGPDAERRRNECLRALRKLGRTPKIKVEHIDTL